MDFDYFYGEQSEQYAFYRTPKVFYTDEKFRGLSSDAKTLYGILLDRVSLSARNKWNDADGRVYVFMTINSVERALGCAHQKACSLMAELEEFGLIERKKQGLGKPTKIYVKNFIQVWNSYSQKYENHTSGGMEITPQEVCQSAPNNTDNNKTKLNNTNLISSGDSDDDSREKARQYFIERLAIEALKEDYPFEGKLIDEILELIVDTVCSGKETVRICGEYKPSNVVKSVFMKLNQMHISYVLDCFKANSTEIRNIKQYLLATLYNAPHTINGYYTALVNHDMAEGKI